MRSWGVFRTANSKLAGVLLHFGNTVAVVDSHGECAESFSKIVDTVRDVIGVRGSKEAVSALPNSLKRYRAECMQDSSFLKLTAAPNCNRISFCGVRKASINDLSKLVMLYSTAEDMFRDRSNLKSILRNSRVWAAEVIEPNREAKFVSAALINVEGRSEALIGGVYTHPEYRGRGYASACTAGLSLELQKEGKLPLLFYENPTAGRIYKTMGFEEIDLWALLYLKLDRVS